MAEWKKLRKILLDQGVTGDEIAAALEAIDNRTRTMKDLDKRASLEAIYDNTLDRLRRDERYADRTDEEIERAAGQYFRNTIKMSATPRGRALLTRLGTLEATEFAMDYATIEAAADAAGVEAEVIETQARPMRESSAEEVAAGRPVPPSPSFRRAGIPQPIPVGPLGTVSPDPATFTMMETRDRFARPSPPMAPVVSDEQAEREFFASPDTPLAYSPAGPAAPTREMRQADVRRRALEALAADREVERADMEFGFPPPTADEALPLPDASMDPEAGLGAPTRWMIHPRTGEMVPADSLDALDQLEALEGGTQNAEDVLARRSWRMEYDHDAWLAAQPGLAGDRGLSEEEYFAKRQAEQPWPDLDSLPGARPPSAEASMPDWGSFATLEGQRPAAGGPAEMVKQAQADNVASQQDSAAAQQAAQPPSPDKGYSNSEIAGMVVGGAGLAAAIGNTIADFRTTRGLERQLAASAAGDTIARREGALAGSQAQRNIMATSMGRRDISPALALRNAQMTGSRAMSDIYGRAAVESARERREAEAHLAHMRKKRWNTLFSGLTQTGATVGSFLTAEGAAQTGAAKRGAGGGNAGS